MILANDEKKLPEICHRQGRFPSGLWHPMKSRVQSKAFCASEQRPASTMSTIRPIFKMYKLAVSSVFASLLATQSVCALPLVGRSEADPASGLRSRSILPVAIYGKDKRQFISETTLSSSDLSSSEKDRIRNTTGIIYCPGKTEHHAMGSALLVGDGSYIVTVAHVLQDEKTMKWREPLEKCVFRTQGIPSHEVGVDISKDRKSGFTMGRNFPSPSDDFAVIKLKSPVRIRKPFPVDLSQQPLKDGDTTLVVSALMNDMRRRDDSEPIVQKCEIRNVGLKENSYIFSSCDVKKGASGSAHLFRNQHGDLVIKAIVVAEGSEDNNAEYSFFNEHTVSIGVDGEFLGTIETMDPTVLKTGVK